MSSLSEQERIGLEEVFLSISSSQSMVQKWSFWSRNLTIGFHAKSLKSPVIFSRHSKSWLKNTLKNHKITKLLTKIEKRRKI